ncbi:hypothetical protein RvY_11473 [Ramazzottius varieornatus]|uniref:Uncharacterized protein n=1 Tax=Ramazzottius varieornatus TaxID=947166 RepID=A0A1D1VNZ7_RAMVA|nr:hypothetical protein RvY_11473 [Ramazzottius varieornatus]
MDRRVFRTGKAKVLIPTTTTTTTTITTTTACTVNVGRPHGQYALESRWTTSKPSTEARDKGYVVLCVFFSL